MLSIHIHPIPDTPPSLGQVKTVDGRTVWRRRHYRVKRDQKPGTFRFSVRPGACLAL